jgi:hypothetical protein
VLCYRAKVTVDGKKVLSEPVTLTIEAKEKKKKKKKAGN